MASIQEASRTAEELARVTRESYRTVFDFVVASQERNARFFRGVLEDSAREVRRQAESNRAVTRELVERAEGQRDAFRALAGESIDAYANLFSVPLSYYKQGLRLVENEGDGFPIRDYDSLNVEEISKQIDGLSAEEIRKARDYEKRHKNRETLIERFDRKLRAAS